MSNGKPNWAARIALVGTAALVLTAVGGAVATADGTDDPAPTVRTYEVLREVVKPWDSIRIPSASCPGGYLHNHNYSPGRMVPAGVEVVEPGGVGVTIAKGAEKGPVWTENGRLVQPIDGWDADQAYSGATNWDPFASHEVVIKVHCTWDTDHAVVDDLGPSPS
jgi:hypothetical protein